MLFCCMLFLCVVYRPWFSGHKILLCDRPYWGECGEPFAPGLSRAAGGILLQQPVLVIARDEGPDRGANLLGIAEDPAPPDLLLEGADEPLRHTVGLGLADKGKARRQAEEGDLVLEGVGHKGAAVVVAEQKAAGSSQLVPAQRDTPLGYLVQAAQAMQEGVEE